MLSKPYPESSTGSHEPGFTSTASRSRIALLYSARFSRCTGARPGFGFAAAALSSVRLEERRKGRSGRGLRTRAHVGRRHLARPHLQQNLFPNLAVRRNLGQAEALKRKSAGFGLAVMAADAAFFDQSGMRRGIRRRRRGRTGLALTADDGRRNDNSSRPRPAPTV